MIGDQDNRLSRRSFLGNVTLVAATSAILQARNFLGTRGWLEAAQSTSPDLVDTFSGLLAFVVPGPDSARCRKA